MIYEKIKPKTLTAKDMYNSFPILVSNFDKIVRRFGFHAEIPWNEETEVFFFEVGLIQDLIKYNFIKEIKNEIIYDESKFYFFKSPTNEVYTLTQVDEEKIYWVCITSKYKYHSDAFNSFQSAIDYRKPEEMLSFNSFQEAMNYYFPKEEMAETKLDKINKLHNLIEELGINIDCEDIFGEFCDDIKCKECKFN